VKYFTEVEIEMAALLPAIAAPVRAALSQGGILRKGKCGLRIKSGCRIFLFWSLP
jgi:hypothetical protein